MKRQFFSGNSLEQALLSAARRFGIEPERVAYTLREKKHGFIKSRRRFVIEVDPAEPERPPEERAPAPSADPVASAAEEPAGEPTREQGPPAAPRRAADPIRHGAGGDSAPAAPLETQPMDEQPMGEQSLGEQPLGEKASIERAVLEILRFLRVRADVSVERRPDGFEVEISDPDRDALLDREGRVLQAMEYLVPRLVRSWLGRGLPVKIDCDGFRARREQELTALADRTAERVRRDGTPQSLEPMSPADRRLIHLALAEDVDVETESEGQGFFKRVRIFAVETLVDGP